MGAQPMTGQDLVDLGWLPPVRPGRARAVIELDIMGTQGAPDWVLHATPPEGMDLSMFADGCAQALTAMADRARAEEQGPDVVAEAERIARSGP